MSRPDVLIGELVERVQRLEAALSDVVLAPPERFEAAQARAREALREHQARASWEASRDQHGALAELGRLVQALDRAHLLDERLFAAWQAARRELRRLTEGAS